ncbi:unnamed protein product, partial [Symbiodinium sp. KB8]
MDIFGSDEMLAVLETGEACKPHLLGMCYEFCVQHIRSKRTLDVLQRHSALRPIADSLGRVMKICRCLVHLLGGVWPDSQEATSAQDVLDFMQAKSVGAERRLRLALSKADTFWQESYQDVLKCGSQGVLLAPDMERLRTLVEPEELQDWVSGESITEAVRISQALDGKLRAVELSPVVSQLHTLCKASMRKVVASTGREVPAGLAHALLQAALSFNRVPGFESARLELEEWLRTQSTQVAFKDLLQLMRAAVEPDHGLDYEVAVTLLQKIDVDEMTDQDKESLQARANAYMAALADFIVEKVVEPTPTEINAVLPLLLKLAELVYGQSSPKMMSYVGSVVKFVKGAVLLSTTLAKLHTQKSRAARLASASDKDFRLLLLLKQTRAAFRENAAAVSAHQAELAHMPDLERAFAAYPWVPNLERFIKDATFADIVDAQVEVFTRQLHAFAHRLKQDCQNMAEGQSSWWRAKVSTDAKFHVLSLLANETVTTLDPA